MTVLEGIVAVVCLGAGYRLVGLYLAPRRAPPPEPADTTPRDGDFDQ